MFFIAGISPKTKIFEDYPQRCSVCGLQQAFQTRIDHYLNIFFIPVMRVKKGEPFLICSRCHRTKNEFRRNQSPYQEETGLLCKFCGSPIHRGFFYCPYCGKKLWQRLKGSGFNVQGWMSTKSIKLKWFFLHRVGGVILPTGIHSGSSSIE